MSEHFTLPELLHSDTAVLRGIENHPSWDDVRCLGDLAETLEKIRRILGSHPITVTSAFRCAALNAEVGGVPDSAHLRGYAVDFVCPAFGTPSAICAALVPHVKTLAIDQLIDESGWVHVGLCDREPRGMYFKV